MALETIINRGLDGSIVEAYKRCTVCGASHFWADRCIYELTGAGCKPRPAEPKAVNVQAWRKYRRVSAAQVNFDGQHVNAKFWGRV